jgi:carbonic anhydrase
MTSSADLIRQAKGGLQPIARQPSGRLAVVTCMDVRIDPLAALGLADGEAHVIRNAGAVVTPDVIRSVAVSQRRLDTVAVDLMMHTDCGMLGLDEEALRREITAASGRPVGVAFHAFDDLHAELRRGVETLRHSPVLATRSKVRGLIYDVTTQRATVVVP